MAEVQTLLTGLAFGESPRWHEGRLWFCNWGMQEVRAVDTTGTSEVMAHVPTTLPFSIDWLPDGRLLVVLGREGQLLCGERGGPLTPYTDLRGVSSGIWNEMVVDGRGNIYLNGGIGPQGGIIAVVTPDRKLRQVADGIAFPNGMVITPDNSTLIIAESFAGRLTAFDIEPSGGLSNRRVWANLGDGAPDGICLDADHAVWYSDVPHRSCVRVREGGEVLQTLHLDRGCFACMLGGAQHRTLFMLAAEWRGFDQMARPERTGLVLSTEVSVPGAGWPSAIA